MSDHRPFADIFGYRGVEYGVHQCGAGDWMWTYYPKVGTGVKTQGSVKGGRETAIAACKAAIDVWLGPRLRVEKDRMVLFFEGE